jgi:hypothetical protein
MPSTLDRAVAALLPRAGLAALAGVRCRDDVQVIVNGERAWVTWPAATEAVWQALLAVPGIEFFESRDGRWHGLGRRLPRVDVPLSGEAKRLEALLFPAPVQAEPPPMKVGRPIELRILPSERVQPASALRASVTQIIPWAEAAPALELRACRAAISGEIVVLLGARLPAVPSAERFWGESVLVPLGFRPEPDLPESALRAAAHIRPEELLVLTEAGAEAIPKSAFEPLARAALRKIACG